MSTELQWQLLLLKILNEDPALQYGTKLVVTLILFSKLLDFNKENISAYFDSIDQDNNDLLFECVGKQLLSSKYILEKNVTNQE